MASSIKGTSNESLDETVKNVNLVLGIAGEHNLQAEVFATAMLYLKENPESSIDNALEVGLGDWDI